MFVWTTSVRLYIYARNCNIIDEVCAHSCCESNCMHTCISAVPRILSYSLYLLLNSHTDSGACNIIKECRLLFVARLALLLQFTASVPCLPVIGLNVTAEIGSSSVIQDSLWEFGKGFPNTWFGKSSGPRCVAWAHGLELFSSLIACAKHSLQPSRGTPCWRRGGGLRVQS